MNSEFLKKLQDISGDTSLITGSSVKERKAGIWIDEPIGASAIVRPKNTKEVSQILALCNKSKVEVVTHGGLTGLSQGAIANKNQLALSTELMTDIEEIDLYGRTMTTQSGVKLQTIQEVSEQNNMFFPLDLGARGSCSIGGNASTNAGGNKVIRYGMTRELILGLEAVLADGTIISSMNKMLKNNTGYDLKQLFIGSEGTLGIITKLVLRLKEKPSSENTALIACDSFEKVKKLLKHFDSGLAGSVTAFEVMWKEFYTLVTTAPAKSKPPIRQDYPYYILVEYSGFDQKIDSAHFNSLLEDGLEKDLISDAVIAKNTKERTDLWGIRDDVEQQFRLGPIKIFDVSLPINDMEAYLENSKKLFAEKWKEFHFVVFGHLADGNLHIIAGVNQDDKDSMNQIENCIYEPLRDINGSVSAEHGIGLEKLPYLNISRNEEEINLMRTLKKSLDPNNILNPGKIFN
ncbi:MAG: FAD-binding oxidoreductase [Gammaproteobacteria bacterium]